MKWHIIVNEKGHSLPEMFKLEKGTMQNSMLIHFDISIHCMVFWKKQNMFQEDVEHSD